MRVVLQQLLGGVDPLPTAEIGIRKIQKATQSSFAKSKLVGAAREATGVVHDVAGRRAVQI